MVLFSLSEIEKQNTRKVVDIEIEKETVYDDCSAIKKITYEWDGERIELPTEKVHSKIKSGEYFYIKEDGEMQILKPAKKGVIEYVRTLDEDSNDDPLLELGEEEKGTDQTEEVSEIDDRDWDIEGEEKDSTEKTLKTDGGGMVEAQNVQSSNIGWGENQNETNWGIEENDDGKTDGITSEEKEEADEITSEDNEETDEASLDEEELKWDEEPDYTKIARTLSESVAERSTVFNSLAGFSPKEAFFKKLSDKLDDVNGVRVDGGEIVVDEDTSKSGYPNMGELVFHIYYETLEEQVKKTPIPEILEEVEDSLEEVKGGEKFLDIAVIEPRDVSSPDKNEGGVAV